MSMIGRVEWFSVKKAYGFIQDIKTNESFFCHKTNIESPFQKLFPGEYVSFDVRKTDNDKNECVRVTGVEGGPLLSDSTKHYFRVYPKRIVNDEPEQPRPEDMEA